MCKLIVDIYYFWYFVSLVYVHVIGGAGIPRRFDAKREENNVGGLHVASQGTQCKCD